MKSHIKKSKCNTFSRKPEFFDGDVMHLLFVLFTFSLIFEIVIAICVVLFCNSPFLCSFKHDLSERDITFLCLIGG